MLSFWEREAFLNYDHIVLGGGIVGLSTAISLKEADANASVLVLERGTFPTGASTKNAGFACFGSLTEILADLKTMSPAEVLELVELRWEGLKLLRSRLGDEAIEYKNYGGYELLKADQARALDRIDAVNEMLYPLFRQKVYEEKTDDLSRLGFNTELVKSLVLNPLEGQIHTGKMMRSLQTLAAEKGVEMITGTEVLSFEENSQTVEVRTKSISFKTAKLAVCTNAFSEQLLPGVDLEPGRGVVLVTKPVAGLKFKGTFHYDEGYYYFRNYENRVIFGGGRNLDISGESTTNFEVRDLIVDKLKLDLQELILPGQQAEIDQVWSGIMAFGANKQPILKRKSERVCMGIRLGGMGVAIGSKMGSELSRLMLQ